MSRIPSPAWGGLHLLEANYCHNAQTNAARNTSRLNRPTIEIRLEQVRTENLALLRSQLGVAPVVLDILWEDMAAALDVWPNSYRVRTHEDVYLDGLKARLAEQAAARESKQPCKQNQRRGPPPDRQGRLEFASQ